MTLSNKEIYDYLNLNQRGFKVEKWGAKGVKGGDKKALACVLGQHIFYVKVDVKKDHNYSFVFDPKTSDKILKLLDNISGCGIEKEKIKDHIQWKYDHSTAFKAFEKIQNTGKNPINYGYRARFESYDALENFLQIFLGDNLNKSPDVDATEFRFSKNELDSVEAIENNPKFNKTEGNAFIKIRIGQSSFRDYLKKYWGGCAVTGCTLIESLIASHIKPWHQCKDEPEHRLNKFNGFLLTPNLDKLFDLGLISFENNGNILISPEISSSDYVLLGINAGMRLRKGLQYEHHQFLQHHRKAHGFED